MPGFDDGGIALTIALGTRLNCAIANDSGTGHMLGLVQIPLAVIYGRTNSKKYLPYTPNAVAVDSKLLNNSKDVASITLEQVLKACRPIA